MKNGRGPLSIVRRQSGAAAYQVLETSLPPGAVVSPTGSLEDATG